MSERKRTRTQRAILHAAKVLYEKQGVGNVPFDDIAETAGVCRTTVFNHFADAAELQQAIAVAEIGDLIEFGEESHLCGLALIHALLDKLIDDTANYPRVMARLANATILGGESGRVGEIERLIARQFEKEFDAALSQTKITAGLLAQMTMGLYYGQVNHQLAFGLPFEAEQMKKQMRVMLALLLRGMGVGE
ncbi:MAG: TetR/AcrR family transcriptional regulator [Eubacteriales bacterium]|jgi:AcrR family transcriptional regulator|nr:TetR/AcrR family transcriptional regulator [Eubacteriales bacterium]